MIYEQKITQGEMRETGVHGLLVYCSDLCPPLSSRREGSGGNRASQVSRANSY